MKKLSFTPLSKKFLAHLWNLKYYYHIHKNASLDLIVRQMNLAHVTTYLLTELNPSWGEAANGAAIQDIPSNIKEPEVSSPCPQEPSTGPYPEPVRSSPHHPILPHPMYLEFILIHSCHLRLGLSRCFFPPVFPNKILYGSLHIFHACYERFMSFSFVCSTETLQHFAVSSMLLSFLSSRSKCFPQHPVLRCPQFVKSSVFYSGTLCSPVKVYRRFGGVSYPRIWYST
jgi:hypothetical protein